jgi:hypothetical protein
LQDSGNGLHLFAGFFDMIVNIAPRDDPDRAASSPPAEECVAVLRRRTLALERR